MNDNPLINLDAVSSRRIQLEDASIIEPKKGNWLCHYCSRRFVNEFIFERHTCKEKQRAKEIASPLGQAAYGYYNTWMKIRKFKEQSVDAFMSSRYYKAFVRFANMVPTAGITDPEQYIKLMNQFQRTPDMWHRNAEYKLYLDWFDKIQSPLDQVADSIKFLMDIADKEGVDYTQIIPHLGVSRLILYINKKQLSPWFLLNSSAVFSYLKSIPKDHLTEFDRSISVSTWHAKFEENPVEREKIRSLIKDDFGL